MLRRTLLTGAAVTLTTGCATVRVPRPDMEAPRMPFSEHVQRLMMRSRVVKPDGDGPFPVALQFHGCGGNRSLQSTWAEAISQAGWAAVMVDSYAPREISYVEALTTICLGVRFWGRERAGDLFAAMAWLRAQPWADAQKVVAIGWSHGGWAILDALALAPGVETEAATKLDGLPETPLDGLVGAFLLYPYLGLGSVARETGLLYDVRPMAIVGGRDVIVGGRSLERALGRVATPGAPIQVVRFDDATHAFDDPDARDLRVRYSAELTERARLLLLDYLRLAVAV